MQYKILILSLTYLPYIGGAEIAVKETTNRLGADFCFDMVTARLNRKLPKFEKINNINIYRIGFGCKTLDKYIFTFFGFLKALNLYRKNKYKIIWSIMAAYSSFAVLFKIFTRAKVVLTLQEGDPIEYITDLKRFKIFLLIYKLYFKLIDKVTVISNFLGKWAKDLGIKDDKIIVVPNGVDIKKFSDLKKEKDNKSKIILTVSRLVEKNGVEYLIRALKLLITDYGLLITELLIVGNGKLRNKLENLVRNLDLADKVKFLGELSFEETQKYYGIADIFCRSSLSEGFGNVFVEAMAAGVPVIATPVGGIVDFLQDKKTGWFCEVKNPESIAEKISYILDEKNKVEVEQVIFNAKKMAQEKYSWDKIAGKMGGIFIKIIKHQETIIKKRSILSFRSRFSSG